MVAEEFLNAKRLGGGKNIARLRRLPNKPRVLGRGSEDVPEVVSQDFKLVGRGGREKLVNLAFKESMQSFLPGMFVQNYQLCKKAGLPVPPTYRLAKTDRSLEKRPVEQTDRNPLRSVLERFHLRKAPPKRERRKRTDDDSLGIVMTDLTEGGRYIVESANNKYSFDVEGAKITEIKDVDVFAQRLASIADSATAARLLPAYDCFFFKFERADGPAEITCIAGDFGIIAKLRPNDDFASDLGDTNRDIIDRAFSKWLQRRNREQGGNIANVGAILKKVREALLPHGYVRPAAYWFEEIPQNIFSDASELYALLHAWNQTYRIGQTHDIDGDVRALIGANQQFEEISSSVVDYLHTRQQDRTKRHLIAAPVHETLIRLLTDAARKAGVTNRSYIRILQKSDDSADEPLLMSVQAEIYFAYLIARAAETGKKRAAGRSGKRESSI